MMSAASPAAAKVYDVRSREETSLYWLLWNISPRQCSMMDHSSIMIIKTKESATEERQVYVITFIEESNNFTVVYKLMDGLPCASLDIYIQAIENFIIGHAI